MNGIEWKRHTLGWITIAVQAKIVILLHTIDGQAVKTRVRTGAVNVAHVCFIDVDARIDPQDVIYVAVDRRQVLEVVKVESCRWPDGHLC